MSKFAVCIEALSKNYDALRAVDQLDLTVEQGEILAVLGPSGAGKTTMLRLIAGFETPDEGTVEVGGQQVVGVGVNLPPEKRRVGMVFQDYALFPHLTVGENVAYGVKRGVEQAARVSEILALVGLTGQESRMPHKLSGGQQQRVALARALAPKPDVLLMDEPFSNLDAALRIRVREEIREILKSNGASAIFVTHNQEEALFMGDQVAVIDAGHLEQVGTPDQIFGSPASRFVASFMGQTDFLPGEVTLKGLATEIGTLTQHVDLPVGTQVEVAVRADDVTFTQDPASSGRVLARYFKGTVNVYRIRLPSGRIVHSLQPHTLTLAPGTPVRTWANPGHPLAWFPLNNA